MIIRSERATLLAVVGFVALAAPFASPVFGLKTAAMKVPPELAADAIRLPVSGFGGKNRGEFTIGDFSGEFTRIESRLAIFDPAYASSRGTASFAIAGPGIDGRLRADCSFKENVVTLGVVTFDSKKLAFVCELDSSSGGTVGRVVLGEPRPEGFKQRLLARAARTGAAEIGATRLELASVHEYEGSRFKSQTPTGYVVTSNASVVGALELTDVNPTIFVASSLSDDDRRSTMLAALAVSLLRDPAVSTLGD